MEEGHSKLDLLGAVGFHGASRESGTADAEQLTAAVASTPAPPYEPSVCSPTDRLTSSTPVSERTSALAALTFLTTSVPHPHTPAPSAASGLWRAVCPRTVHQPMSSQDNNSRPQKVQYKLPLGPPDVLLIINEPSSGSFYFFSLSFSLYLSLSLSFTLHWLL